MRKLTKRQKKQIINKILRSKYYTQVNDKVYNHIFHIQIKKLNISELNIRIENDKKNKNTYVVFSVKVKYEKNYIIFNNWFMKYTRHNKRNIKNIMIRILEYVIAVMNINELYCKKGDK